MSLKNIIAVLESTAAEFVPGFGPAAALARATIDFAGAVRDTLSSDDQAALDAALPALLAEMNMDVDETLRLLRGG